MALIEWIISQRRYSDSSYVGTQLAFCPPSLRPRIYEAVQSSTPSSVSHHCPRAVPTPLQESPEDVVPVPQRAVKCRNGSRSRPAPTRLHEGLLGVFLDSQSGPPALFLVPQEDETDPRSKQPSCYAPSAFPGFISCPKSE